jgi:flagellin
MAISLVNNLASLDTQARVSTNASKLNSTLQRLSSGLRINNSGDDAAGLAIANAYRSDISTLRQGVRNANDAISTLQTIDGGMNTIANLLDRAMTLATQAASDTFAGDRAMLTNEMAKVTAEIDRQAANIGLNDGGAKGIENKVYIGGNSDSGDTNNYVTVDLSATQVDSDGLGVDSLDLTTTDNAKDAIASIKTAVGILGTEQGKVGAGQNNLSQAIELATSQMTNFQAAESRVRDADIAAEASDMARLTTLQQAGVAALAQANQSSQAVLSLLR